MKRSCLECALFHFHSGSYAYSEYTPGDDPKMGCDATPSHWDLSLFQDEESDIRKALLTADTCPDFTQVKE